MGIFSNLFGKKKNNTFKQLEIISPISGYIVDLETVPDPVFSEKIAGDGIAIKPSGDQILAPINGTIGKIFKTKHAFSIESENSDLEMFVHFGIDTIKLKGEGFTQIAEEGQKVKKGDLILKYNLSFLEKNAKSTITPVIISNMDEIIELKKVKGKVIAGITIIMYVKK
ncbi:PTS system glucose-specific EIIA component [Buchnera aphidicola (Eriosoma grossulariae)]|uniref:PTS glucose transporter subunit IIA n=1 Tax=Buchnera aphidicola TaxID=9 RepID=UPI0034638699